MTRTLVIGSRGSKLALWQAEEARVRLISVEPDLDVRIEIVKTSGDIKSEPLSVIGGKGVFTKEIEEALLEQRIDLAVHSLKDLPTTLPEGLMIAAMFEREDPRDALILRRNLAAADLKSLQTGAVVGTSSPRRLVQLRNLRPDVNIKDVRGNVDTRLRKLDEGQYDALILACAGLRRLQLADRITAAISPVEMMPAVGQGAIALETRAADERTNASVMRLDHRETRFACAAERELLRTLGGGCQLPIAAHATIEAGMLVLRGLVATPDGSLIIRDETKGEPHNAEAIGRELADHLIAQGANSLLRPDTA